VTPVRQPDDAVGQRGIAWSWYEGRTQPTDETNDIDGRGRRHMVQMRTLLPNVARAASSHCSDPLRNGPLDACTRGIQGLEVLSAFAARASPATPRTAPLVGS
jgi:hypothetical protein